MKKYILNKCSISKVLNCVEVNKVMDWTFKNVNQLYIRKLTIDPMMPMLA